MSLSSVNMTQSEKIKNNKKIEQTQLTAAFYLFLSENPLRLNTYEKFQLKSRYLDFLKTQKTSNLELVDFLNAYYKTQSREASFMAFLESKKDLSGFVKVLDVGAGKVCALSKEFARRGKQVYAMDTDIRLSPEELKQNQITGLNQIFKCDDATTTGKGTPIDRYDLIVGAYPCAATEHIVRQSLKYEKPFILALCQEPHKGIQGKTFRSAGDWHHYLQSLSETVQLEQHVTANAKVDYLYALES